MPLHIVHHPDYDAKFPVHHRFPMGKYSRLMIRLDAAGVLGRSELHVPEPASRDRLARAHAADYVDQVIELAVPKPVEREIGFPIDAAVSRRAQLATGGTLLAARLALEHGLACNAAGGSHHARRAHGAGFCTFNDVAVAALALLDERAVERVLVIDVDVHQGDGTAEILAGEPRVFTVSVHADKNYPVRKMPSNLDVGLPDRTCDEAYLAKLAELLPVVHATARPDIVFYNAGVDPHEEDRLGRLSLSDAGLLRREHLVLDFFRSRNVPFCGVIGGGYSLDVEALAARHALLFAAAGAYT